MAITFPILAGTSIYCLMKLPPTPTVAHGTYGIILVNSVLGTWKWVFEDGYDSTTNTLYNNTAFLQNIFALPCIASTVWMSNTVQYSWEVAQLHLACPLAPLFTHYYEEEPSEDLVNLLVCLTSISMGVVSYQKNCFYGIAASITYAVNHFVIRTRVDFTDSIQSLDLYNIGLAVFEYLALIALAQGSSAE